MSEHDLDRTLTRTQALIGIVSAAIGIGGAYMVTNYRVGAVETRVEKLEQSSTETREIMIEIRSDVRWLRERKTN